MKRTFATATSLGCIALLSLALQTVPLFGKDNPSRDKTDKPAKADNAPRKKSVAEVEYRFVAHPTHRHEQFCAGH